MLNIHKLSVSFQGTYLFEKITFQSVKHTGIGAHFKMKLIQIWARIRHIYETYLGAFQSETLAGAKPRTHSGATCRAPLLRSPVTTPIPLLPLPLVSDCPVPCRVMVHPEYAFFFLLLECPP